MKTRSFNKSCPSQFVSRGGFPAETKYSKTCAKKSFKKTRNPVNKVVDQLSELMLNERPEAAEMEDDVKEKTEKIKVKRRLVKTLKSVNPVAKRKILEIIAAEEGLEEFLGKLGEKTFEELKRMVASVERKEAKKEQKKRGRSLSEVSVEY
ncbi:hypothetical protein L596_023981 [Steinernema carpocapsae]|uniref:Uncharacterized protein n=1 Tax=Steinernema carpocapsae TaxID=34508 RepID=A0A4U5MFA9_STECR|nr:hypothetical protein L596_023981 [Steinernema carpocapsae]